MKTLLIILFCYWAFIPNNDSTKEAYNITVNIKNLKNTKGTLIFFLYNAEGSLPDEKLRRYYKKMSAKINYKSIKASFVDLPKGNYAVTVLHDENNNGKIDRKFMLPLPKEGLGFSNYDDFGISNRPNFKDASFNLQKDKTITIKVIYK